MLVEFGQTRRGADHRGRDGEQKQDLTTLQAAHRRVPASAVAPLQPRSEARQPELTGTGPLVTGYSLQRNTGQADPQTDPQGRADTDAATSEVEETTDPSPALCGDPVTALP